MQCAWLIVEGNKNNKVEADKRSEILYEFIWWIFDCFVISLLQVRKFQILDTSQIQISCY